MSLSFLCGKLQVCCCVSSLVLAAHMATALLQPTLAVAGCGRDLAGGKVWLLWGCNPGSARLSCIRLLCGLKLSDDYEQLRGEGCIEWVLGIPTDVSSADSPLLQLVGDSLAKKWLLLAMLLLLPPPME